RIKDDKEIKKKGCLVFPKQPFFYKIINEHLFAFCLSNDSKTSIVSYRKLLIRHCYYIVVSLQFIDDFKEIEEEIE
ncbi:hypothetical protein, partial [Priestia megaterium]|uniref:hypothetical protein n=1 Tax=Priestia megaterium TaxID=1404 RepID=UPI0030080CF3